MKRMTICQITGSDTIFLSQTFSVLIENLLEIMTESLQSLSTLRYWCITYVMSRPSLLIESTNSMMV